MYIFKLCKAKRDGLISPDKQGTLNMYIFKLCKAKREGLISPDKQGTTCISSSYARQSVMV